MPVSVLLAMYLRGLYGSCAGSINGFGRGRFVCTAPSTRDAAPSRSSAAAHRRRPRGIIVIIITVKQKKNGVHKNTRART